MINHLLLVGREFVGIEAPAPTSHPEDEQWALTTVQTGAEAKSLIASQPVDIIVVDHTLPDMTGLVLLNWIHERFPRVLRLIAVTEEDREEVLEHIVGQHHFLIKPLDPSILVDTTARVAALNRVLPNVKLQALAERIRAFPPLPTLYLKVMKELRTSDFSADRVGEMIEQDLGMTTRLLQVVNSSFFGVPRRIASPMEAVNLLGGEAIKVLLISIHVFLKHDKVKPLYFSIHQVWQHSVAVARGARQIVLKETRDEKLAHDAYAAGLLHDIGKLVLADNFEVEYNQVQKTARTESRPLWEVEKEVFGVSHAELGAFLLGRWGMPISLLEPIALHHQPKLSRDREFSVLSAVHVANALHREPNASKESVLARSLDIDYLERLDLEERIESWSRLLNIETPPSIPRTKEASQASKKATETPTSAEIVPPPSKKSNGTPDAETPHSIAETNPASDEISPSPAATPRSLWVTYSVALCVCVALAWIAVDAWNEQSSAPATARSLRGGSAKTRPGVALSTPSPTSTTTNTNLNAPKAVSPVLPTQDENSSELLPSPEAKTPSIESESSPKQESEK